MRYIDSYNILASLCFAGITEEATEGGFHCMPTYEYKCYDCGTRFERFQSITDEAIQDCPECKGKVKRLISAGAGLIFKGSGFYTTDYRDGSYKEAEKKDRDASSSSGDDSKSSDTKSSDTKSSDTESSDTESSDTESSDTESSDTKSSDTKNVDIKSSDTMSRAPSKSASDET
jgi:putative FmdB family regulatory protein